MVKSPSNYQALLFFYFLLLSNSAYAIDIVKLQIQQYAENKASHNIEVIQRALEVTKEQYGPYQLDVVKFMMSGNRMRQSSLEGSLINTVVMPADKEWDKKHLAIKVPVRLGLLSYRLLLINKSDLAKFEHINTLEELQKLSAGLVSYWVTTRIFKEQELNFVETGHFDGIFWMLDRNRFDYLPRGVHEIYDELESRKSVLEDVVVEPHLVLNVPTLTYIYVSPKEPRIASRIEEGAKKLLESGELKKILYRHYKSALERAQLHNRRVIKIESKDYNQRENYYEDYLMTTDSALD